ANAIALQYLHMTTLSMEINHNRFEDFTMLRIGDSLNKGKIPLTSFEHFLLARVKETQKWLMILLLTFASMTQIMMMFSQLQFPEIPKSTRSKLGSET
ncbi:14425_t:CDS:2, partial [Dentiscutata erythropus]